MDKQLKNKTAIQALMDNLHVGVLLHDANGRLTGCNKSALQILGISKSELEKQNICAHSTFFLQEDGCPLPLTEQPLQRVLKTQKTIKDLVICWQRPKEHDLNWLLVSAAPCFDENGVLQQVICSFSDITSMKNAETELRRTKQRLDEILQLTPAVIYKCGAAPDYPITYITENCQQLLGYPADAFHKDSLFWSHHVHREDKERFLRDLALTEKRDLLSCEYRFISGNGDCIWLYDTATPSFDESGKIDGFVGNCIDITRLKLAEKTLKESEKRLRDLYDNAPDMYIILNLQGDILDFNKRCYNRLGYEYKSPGSASFVTIVHPDDSDRVNHLLRLIKQTGEISNIPEVRLMSKDGEIIWVSIEFSLFTDLDGTVQSIRLVCRDINQRRKLQDELARTQRLETAGRIAAQIGHDYNNLLAPLTAYPGLIRQEYPDNENLTPMLNEMESAARKIADINQQLLALGRRGHYSMEPIDLNEFILNTLALHPIPDEVIVKRTLAPELQLIKGGAAQLTRVLTNLINNAIEAMQNIGILTIKTEFVVKERSGTEGSPVENNEFVKLSIGDNGTGVKPVNISKIFEPFFTTKKIDKVRGSGLGLSVVHGIVEDHLGFIEVESTVGTGTTFHLYFPARPESEIIDNFYEDNVRGGTEHLLVVDDDSVQRRVTSQLLQRIGYTVNSVDSGEAAIQYCQRHDVDLLILDMIMEGIDGAETYRRILEFRPQQKAIIVSGYVISARAEQMLQMGAGQFVPKPITLKSIATATRKELDSTLFTQRTIGLG